MELYIGSKEDQYDHSGLDLDDLYDESDGTEEDIRTLIILNVAQFAIDRNLKFDQVTPMTIDIDSNELDIDSMGDGWMSEVARLLVHVKSSRHCMPTEALLARIADIRWQCFDFDTDLENLCENLYSQELEGSAEDFGKQYMEETDQGIPEHLEAYFDYEAYGQALIDDYDTADWGYATYLFSR